MISADNAMYVSKRAGKDRVTGVPVPVHEAEMRGDPSRAAGRPRKSPADESGVASPS
jgi:hypothetical protein